MTVPTTFQVDEGERRKAKPFFDRARTVADTGNHEYAIDMYIEGLKFDPDNAEAHQALRDISLRRKAGGGKPMGMFKAMKLPKATDDRLRMLNAEMQLAYKPGDTSYLLSLIQAAHKGGFNNTVVWAGPILLRANADDKNPDFNKFIALRDIYVDLEMWKEATDACQAAAQLRPQDMSLLTVLKNLGAQQTMSQGNYEKGEGFSGSVKDAQGQIDLLQKDSGVRTLTMMQREIAEAEAEYKADPDEAGKAIKLADTLIRTEDTPHENRAIELLDQWYKKTKQFRFRFSIGKVKLAQLTRMERSLKAQLQASPADEQLRKEVARFAKEKAEEELKEFMLWTENYPTDMRFRFEVAVRLFLLERYQDAIPVFQQSRNDPKFRADAAVYLGRAFLEAGFPDEAVDTLRTAIEEYQLKGDAKSKEMYYWYGRSLERKNDQPAAIKCYSQVAQWDFNYRDVQARIKKLRAG